MIRSFSGVGLTIALTLAITIVGYAQKSVGEPSMARNDDDQAMARQEIAKSVPGGLVLETIAVREPEWTLLTGAVGLKPVKGDSQDALKLILEASKETYKLGEKLDFSFVLSNIGEKNFQLWDVFSTGPGDLNLQCSTNGKDFSGCSDPSWGTSDIIIREPTLIRPGETISTSTSILWNWKSQDIPTYRFLKSGTYYIRALYAATSRNESGTAIKHGLVSEPIIIIIEEPQGEDLDVWNTIKDDGNFAYLAQWNEIRIPSYKTEERAKFMQKVKEIINAHPNSFYARSLHVNLENFDAAEEKRKAMIEKLNSKPSH